MSSALSLHQFVGVLAPGRDVTPVARQPDLYAELERRFEGFDGHVLMSVVEFSEDWDKWERHPDGDEVVLLLEGQVTFVIETADGEDHVALDTPCEYAIVPRGCWHTAKVGGPTKLLFLTPGAGTEHRPA